MSMANVCGQLSFPLESRPPARRDDTDSDRPTVPMIILDILEILGLWGLYGPRVLSGRHSGLLDSVFRAFVTHMLCLVSVLA